MLGYSIDKVKIFHNLFLW